MATVIKKSIYAKLTILATLLFTPIAYANEVMPIAESMGSANFITGGIGESETEFMQSQAKDYSLELVFVQKMNQTEEYIADVKVKIEDAKQNLVLETIADGPFMLVNLVKGRYLVTTEYMAVTKTQKVDVYANKHQRVVFWWPIAAGEASNVQQMQEDPNSN